MTCGMEAVSYNFQNITRFFINTVFASSPVSNSWLSRTSRNKNRTSSVAFDYTAV
jgi:hypothetical protein